MATWLKHVQKGLAKPRKQVFDEATSLQWAGKNPVAWTELWQTPSVYVRNLRAKPWWEPQELCLGEVLQQNWHMFQEELEEPGKALA